MSDPIKPWQLVVLIPLCLASLLVSAASVALALQAVWDRVPSAELPSEREDQMRQGHQAASDCLRIFVEKNLQPRGEIKPSPDWPGLDAEEWLWKQRNGVCTEWSTINRMIGKD